MAIIVNTPEIIQAKIDFAEVSLLITFCMLFTFRKGIFLHGAWNIYYSSSCSVFLSVLVPRYFWASFETVSSPSAPIAERNRYLESNWEAS